MWAGIRSVAEVNEEARWIVNMSFSPSESLLDSTQLSASFNVQDSGRALEEKYHRSRCNSILLTSFCLCSDVDGIHRDRSYACIKSMSRGFHLSSWLHYTTKTGKECFSFGSPRNPTLREGTRVESLRMFRGRLLDSVQTSSFLARGNSRHLHAGWGLCVELPQTLSEIFDFDATYSTWLVRALSSELSSMHGRE